MENTEKFLLNALLDKYERSALAKGENKVNSLISFKFTEESLPEYFDENTQDYEAIHASLYHLEELHFIQIHWKNRDSIVQKVTLNLDALSDVYCYVKRTSKKEYSDRQRQTIETLRQIYATPVALALMDDLEVRIQKQKSVKDYIELEDVEQTKLLIKAISMVEQNQVPCYLREFSIRSFQDSKTFEKIKGNVIKAFRRFDEENAMQSEKAILAEHNIYDTPNYVYVKGQGKLQIGQTVLSLTCLHQGIGIAGEDLAHVKILFDEVVQKIITIENLTSFFAWQEENSLIIYLGGYHNQARRALLALIYQSYPSATYLHFGDIDAGGFEIYEDLCRKTRIPFQCYHMGIQELKRYEEYSKPLKEHDRKHLEALLERYPKASYGETIRYMLAHDIKLEQECIHS